MLALKRWLIQRPISYSFYLFSVLMVLIGILIINGYFEIQRTRSQLFNILETEALLVIKGLEKNSGNLIATFSLAHSPSSGPGPGERSEESLGIEDLLIERLINLALQLDQEAVQKFPSPQSRINKPAQSGPKQIFFIKSHPSDSAWADLPRPLRTKPPFFQNVLTGKTRLAVFRGEGPWRRTLPLAVAVGRRFDQGAILMILSAEEYVFWGRQIIIQGFLEDFSGKGNIAYLRVEGTGRTVIAQHGEADFADQVPKAWRKEIPSGDPGTSWIRGPAVEFLEVVRPFKPAGQDLGQVRLGMSLKEVNPILDQARRTTILTSIILFGLGLISIFIIFRLQGRHFKKMQELENQIRLKEELSAMGQLAAGVAHEIKNPLNAIGLVVQRLQQEFLRDNPEEQKEYERFTGIVRNEIARVNQIIGHFLMVAKPLEKRLEDCSVIDIIKYVLEVMGEEFRQKRIRVATDWDETIPSIRSDRFQLTQAFLNILNNALESMEEGGAVRVAVRLVNSEQVLVNRKKLFTDDYSRTTSGDFIEISVADTGKGIPPEGLKRIFAHYYTTKEKGVGLGLAITQKIIQAHEGTLEVESVVDQGTIVTVRLPVSPHLY
jgi:signal transduction histidine kinase